MEEFFNSLEEIAQRLKSRKSEMQSMCARTEAGRSPDWPACTTCTAAARSTTPVDRATTRSTEARHGWPVWSTDWHASGFYWRRSTDRSTEGRSQSSGPIDR